MRKKAICIITMTVLLGLTACGNADTSGSQEAAQSESTQTSQEAAQSESAQTSQEQTEHQGKPGGGRGGMRNGNGGGGSVENDEEAQKVIDATKDQFKQFTYEDKETGISLEYSLYIPENSDSEAFPMIMFIPDSTGSGKSAKEIVEQYYGADIWASDEEQEKHPSYVLVPAFTETVVDDDFHVSEQVEAAVHLISDLQNQYSIDKNRLYTTGQSMGCMTSLYLNSKYPELFAASMFVSGQWDISVLTPLENKKFFYITAGGDEKASGGQEEVMEMLKKDNISYSYGTWDAQKSAEEQDAEVQSLIKEDCSANMIRFETGSVLGTDGNNMEHMASFNYAYKLTAVRDWIFQQKN